MPFIANIVDTFSLFDEMCIHKYYCARRLGEHFLKYSEDFNRSPSNETFLLFSSILPFVCECYYCHRFRKRVEYVGKRDMAMIEVPVYNLQGFIHYI